MIIDEKLIENTLIKAESADYTEKENAVKKAENGEDLSYYDIALMLNITEKDLLERIFNTANKIKRKIYGNRVVIFAPLYISNYCVNTCTYCGFKCSNNFARTRLTTDQIQEEVKILEKMGHKRLALEAGEDPKNCSIQYVLDALDAIYSTKLDNGSIRRVNVNIAATTTENYKKLKEKGIGTYILFQETYHKETYEKAHPKGPKSDYSYHLEAFDRANDAGVDDVGAGVLFGLYKPYFEILALMMHNKHLENKYGAGFHTISMPRLKKADGMDLKDYPYLVDDETFKRLVAIVRIAVPLTGIIMSTRETAVMRKQLLNLGVSQVSAGSCTDIGGYVKSQTQKSVPQFEVSDERKPNEVITDLINDGFVPSYCTACYRQGRTGDRFMQLAKSGNIENVCTPNALMTLLEYALDYGDETLLKSVNDLIDRDTNTIKNEKIKELFIKNISLIKEGKRDLYV